MFRAQIAHSRVRCNNTRTKTHTHHTCYASLAHQQATVKVIVGDDCASAGDALRHLDTLDLIDGDFVLIGGDVSLFVVSSCVMECSCAIVSSVQMLV
jgi:hypothetical protein